MNPLGGLGWDICSVCKRRNRWKGLFRSSGGGRLFWNPLGDLLRYLWDCRCWVNPLGDLGRDIRSVPERGNRWKGLPRSSGGGHCSWSPLGS